MTRTPFRYLRQLAGLICMAAIALTGALAQTKDQKTIADKPIERIQERVKVGDHSTGNQPGEPKKTAVEEPINGFRRVTDATGQPGQIKIGPQSAKDGGKGTIITNKPKEDAA